MVRRDDDGGGSRKRRTRHILLFPVSSIFAPPFDLDGVLAMGGGSPRYPLAMGRRSATHPRAQLLPTCVPLLHRQRLAHSSSLAAYPVLYLMTSDTHLPINDMLRTSHLLGIDTLGLLATTLPRRASSARASRHCLAMYSLTGLRAATTSLGGTRAGSGRYTEDRG